MDIIGGYFNKITLAMHIPIDQWINPEQVYCSIKKTVEFRLHGLLLSGL